MPSPKNRVKLTGDTHPPELENGIVDDEDVLAFEPVNAADFEPAASMPSAGYDWQQGGSAQRYMEAAREQVRAKPVAVLAAAFALGFLLARI